MTSQSLKPKVNPQSPSSSTHRHMGHSQLLSPPHIFTCFQDIISLAYLAGSFPSPWPHGGMAQSAVILWNLYVYSGTLAISEFLSVDQISPLNSRLIQPPTPSLYLDSKQTFQIFAWQQSLTFSSPTCSSPCPSHLTWWQLVSFQRLPRPKPPSHLWFPYLIPYIQSSRQCLADFKIHPKSNITSWAPLFKATILSHLACYSSLPSYPLACSPKVYFYHSSHKDPFKKSVIPQLNEHAFGTFHLTQAQNPKSLQWPIGLL